MLKSMNKNRCKIANLTYNLLSNPAHKKLSIYIFWLSGMV